MKSTNSTRLYIIIAIIASLALCAEIALSVFFSSASSGSIAAVETVISGAAETGELSVSFSGSGTLTDAEADVIMVPDTVETVYYAVKNGETVIEGDKLAKVDRSSVMEAISALQEAMDSLDSDIQAASSGSISSTVTARAGGRVIKVYAQSGESVLDAMYDNGALMLISLDGLMAVDIDAHVKVGENLLVVLPDGSEIGGRAAQLESGIVTVTISDDAAELFDTVTIKTADGKTLGSGQLYIHSELKVTGFSGTISQVYVSEGSTVYSGQSLLTLTDTEYDGDYQTLLKKRREYTSLMAQLFDMYSDGYVHAPCNGIVSGISDDAEYALSACATASLSLRSSPSSGATGGFVLLSNITQPPEDNPDDIASPSDPTEFDEPADPTVPSVPSDPDDPDDPVDPVDPAEPIFSASLTYAGRISAVSFGAIAVNVDPTPTSGDYSILPSLSTDAFTLSASLSPSGSVTVSQYKDDALQSSTLSSVQSGDIVLLSFDSTGALSSIVFYRPQTQTDSKPSNGMNGTGGGASGTTASVPEKTYSLKLSTVCSVIPGDVATVNVSVDELDVLNLHTGQSVLVMLDALSGQSFEGIVTAIDPVGTNAGGSTKYIMSITLERSSNMLSGMNVSIQVPTSTVSDALIIPAAAIFENGVHSYVYTDYDKKTDELLCPVEVTTGLSDGSNVQILSGIESGDAYYYRYADTLSYSP